MLWKLIDTTTLVLAIAGIAQAGQLVTPPLERVSSGDDFECFVVNTSGSKEITVTVEIINELGSVQVAAADVTILPGRLLRVEDINSFAIRAYCKITGPTRNVVATFCLEPDGGLGCDVVTTAP